MSSDDGSRDRYARQVADQERYVSDFVSLGATADTQSAEKYFSSVKAPTVVFGDTRVGSGKGRSKEELQKYLDDMARSYSTRAQEIRQRLLFPGRDATIVAGNQPPPSLLGGGDV